MYKKKKGRADLESLKKIYAWADDSEVAVQAVKPILEHLIIAYSNMDEMEKNKDEELVFLLEELVWLEKRLEEETSKNEDFELVIH